jgi:tetratricopeptide (TPR) repeat protein
MATNSRLLSLSLLLFCAAAVHAREAATSAECELAATHAPVADAKSASLASSGELHAQYRLADAWSEAGCFGNALQVLAEAARQHPGDRELQTRLRVARSVVGEERFFDNLDRAEDQARVKRNTFRCTSLQDAAACAELVRAAPDDAQAYASQGDALLKAGRTAEALDSYRRAAALAPNLPLGDKVASLQAQLASSAGSFGEAAQVTPRQKTPVRVARAATEKPRYSNMEPESRSH